MTEHEELAAIYIKTLNEGHGIIERTEQAKRAADAILTAGYRKVEPNWHPDYENDGTYEYTDSVTAQWRRTPALELQEEPGWWERVNS